MRKKENSLRYAILWIAIWAIMGAMFVYFVPAEASAEGYVITENGETKTLKSLGFFTATAYCECRICCGKWSDGITASGVYAEPNHTIAAPKNFKFGTKLVINGHEYTVEDRGGSIKGRRVDIFCSSHAEALRFGRQRVEVFCYE